MPPSCLTFRGASGMNAGNELTYVVCALLPLLLAAAVFANFVR